MSDSRIDLSKGGVFELDIFDLVSVKNDMGLDGQAARAFVLDDQIAVLEELFVDLD
jgi:hypothetical protein